jgi:hypothetical protein
MEGGAMPGRPRGPRVSQISFVRKRTTSSENPKVTMAK